MFKLVDGLLWVGDYVYLPDKINEVEIPGYIARGAHISFNNGYTLSIQWGIGTYSDNHLIGPSLFEYESNTAELAAWGEDGNWLEWPGGDEIYGFVDATWTNHIIEYFMSEDFSGSVGLTILDPNYIMIWI